MQLNVHQVRDHRRAFGPHCLYAEPKLPGKETPLTKTGWRPEEAGASIIGRGIYKRLKKLPRNEGALQLVILRESRDE